VSYLLWVPFAAGAVWLVLWRVKFSSMERVFGLLGLALVVFVVALVQLGPDWSALATDVITPSPPGGEDWGTYGFFAVSLFAAALTPYEVFFFSSGGVEERWTTKDLLTSRINVFLPRPPGPPPCTP